MKNLPALCLILAANLSFGQLRNAIAHSISSFTAVEKKCQSFGGEVTVFPFTGESLQYPKRYIEGSIAVRFPSKFIVNKTCKIRDVIIATKKRFDFGLEDAGIITTQKMPDRIPGKESGKNGEVYNNLLIGFRLS